MTDPNTNWAQPEGTPPVSPVPVAPVPVATPKRKGGGITNVLLVVAAIIAVGGVTFAVGRATAPAAASGFTSRGTGLSGTGGVVPGGSFDPAAGFPGGGGFGGFGDRTMTITGTVKSIDGTTMTITTASGNETTVDISGTTYHAQAAATAADVTAGTTVSVSVTGFGGLRGGSAGTGANASAAPGASGAPSTETITATDVTITAR